MDTPLEDVFENLDGETEILRPVATVVSWFDDRDYGSIRNSAGENLLVIASDIRRDEIGRQYLIVGERVKFSRDAERANKAIYVCPIQRRLYTYYPSDYFETCVVAVWDDHKGHGWCRRPLGGQLSMHWNRITTEGGEDLAEGALIRCRPAPPVDGQHAWQAFDIQIFDTRGSAPVMTDAFRRAGFASDAALANMN